MRGYLDTNHHSQVREGVELWEVGVSLGGMGAPPLIPAPPETAACSSLGSDDTSSSGGSCCSSSTSSFIHRPQHDTCWAAVGDTCSTGMSLRGRDEVNGGGRLSPCITRSRSFGGTLAPPRTRRSLPGHSMKGSTLGGGGSPLQGSVLGQGSWPPPRDLRRMNSLPPYVKVPKTPRPERASILSCAVARGLKDSISATRHDLLGLRKAQHDYRMAKSEGRVYEMDKQIKSAERYLKRLEFLLSQIEDLHDQYSLNQRLRDGVRTMAYAYALSPGKEKGAALSNVRSGFKECTETLCCLEVQIEQLIGTLTLEMKGIQGFARLCPGDVFEVVIKHGPQKWKSRGKVSKDSSQLWDNPFFVFKGLIGEMLVVKAMEVRILGKTVTIGNKVCDTKDLFAPHPQLMTINLNPSGSLKLNLIVTWNPLDGGSEETLTRTSSLSGASPRGRKKSVIPSLSSSPPQYSNFLLPSCKEFPISSDADHDSSFGSMSARSSTTTESASPLSEYRDLPSTASNAGLSTRTDSGSPMSDLHGFTLSRRTDSHDSISFDGRESASPQCDESGNFTLVRKEESRVAQWARYTRYNNCHTPNIDIMSRSFPNLSSQPLSSPNYHPNQRCSPILPLSHSLSHQLNLLGVTDAERPKVNENMAWDCTVPNSLPKVVSRLKTCLEDIQGQFPELHSLEEAVLDLHDMCRHSRSRRDSNTSEISLSVESALECFDFLNAECDDDFGDDNPEECLAKNRKESLVSANSKEPPDPPPPLVTGSPQLDTLLLVHLKHALIMIPDLGKCGPLKIKEREAIEKLQKEGELLSKILEHKQNFNGLKPQHLMSAPHTQVLWDSVVTNDDWCNTGRSVVDGLRSVVGSLVEPESKVMTSKVLEELVRRITDSDIYADCLTITAGHFVQHLHRPLQEIVPEITKNLACTELLLKADPKSIEEALSKVDNLSYFHTKLLCHLSFHSVDAANIIHSYFQKNQSNESFLLSVYNGCLLLLESVNPDDRTCSCAFIGRIFPILPQYPKEQNVKPPESTREDDLSIVSSDSGKGTSADDPSDDSIKNDDLVIKTAKDNYNKEQQIKDELNRSNSKDCESESKITQPNISTNEPCEEALLVLRHIYQNDHSEGVRQSAALSLINLFDSKKL